MALGDFVRGKDAQHDPSQQNNGQVNAMASRQRAAELARVEVPRTKLNGFGTATTNAQQQQQSEGGQRANGTYGYDQNARAEVHDMFDTDAEGIGDSTTVTSLSFDKGDPVQGSEERVPQRDETVRPYAHVDQPLGLANYQQPAASHAYESVTERMRELDSDPEDVGDAGMPVQQARRIPDGIDEYGVGNEVNDENAGPFGWNGNYYAADNGPLSWQRIEEVLHEGRNHQKKPGAAQAAPDQRKWEERPAASGFEDTDGVGYRPRSQTPQPSQNTPVKGRVSVRSRFMTPNFPNERRSGSFGATRRKSQSFIPRPSSVQADPSPERSSHTEGITKPTTAAEEAGSPIPGAEEVINDQQYGQGGMFDNTDLSAIDSPDITEEDDDQHQPTTSASPQLSTFSPASPSASSPGKRPLSPQPPTTAPTHFISDYAPNILQTKTFADLTSESFDYNPAPPQPIFPPQEPTPSLNERLKRLQSLTDEQRRALFSGLTLAEWEESGDWLIEQFGEILQKTKDARRERREVAAVFETEIKRRFESAEAESRDTQGRLNEMRSGGMGVLNKQNSS